MIATLLASALAAATMQSAAELEEACLAFQSEYGGTSDCSCLAEKASEDEDLMAAFMEIQSPEDLEGASSEVMEVIEECAE